MRSTGVAVSTPNAPNGRSTDLPVWGARVRHERAARGLTQAELGRLVGISRDTVARIESGWRGLSDELRIDIAEVFALEPAVLFPYVRERRRARRATGTAAA